MATSGEKKIFQNGSLGTLKINGLVHHSTEARTWKGRAWTTNDNKALPVPNLADHAANLESSMYHQGFNLLEGSHFGVH